MATGAPPSGTPVTVGPVAGVVVSAVLLTVSSLCSGITLATRPTAPLTMI